jgi:dienelactone hydrolase
VRVLKLPALLLGLLLAGCAAIGGGAPAGPQAGAALLPGPLAAESGPDREQEWRLPSPLPGRTMHATLFRPAGSGPFPLAVINHGSEQDGAVRSRLPLPAYPALTDWLLARGYAVLLPQRLGHGRTGGPYLEDQGGCTDADFARAGQATADEIEAALAFMQQQAFVRRNGVLIIGNSAGGWGVVALAARNPPGVAALVNISGGRGGHNLGRPGENCAPDRLVAAAAAFGTTARVPTLWLYAENDTYFPPALSRRLADAFRASGGRADYTLVTAAGPEGHDLIADPTAWSAPLAAFLAP